MGSVIGAIIVGGIIGWLASILAKTNDQMGCLWNIVVGLVGGALGSWLIWKIFDYKPESGLIEFLVGIGGAVLLILILRGIGILRRDKK
jgi:uncharacterized membrane protein YeaQ/YmgE (transglycosylase-associated protein family)